MPRRYAGALLAALLAPLAVASVSAQTTRYVRTTGADAGNDCSVFTSPCLTIQHAITESTAGDVVQVYGGVYAEAVTIDRPLTLKGPLAFGAGGTSRINAAGMPIGITITASNVTVDGMLVYGNNATWAGVLIPVSAATGDLSGITITRTTVRTIRGVNPFSSAYVYGHGIFASAENGRRLSGLTITGNTIENGGGSAQGGGVTSAGSGIFLYGVSGATPGAGAAITGNTITGMADGVRAGVPQFGAGITVADAGNNAPASGARVSGNTYGAMSGGFAVFASNTSVSEAKSAFTDVGALGVNVGALASVDEAAMQPFVYSDAVPAFPQSRVYFASAAAAVASGAPSASVAGVVTLGPTPGVSRDGADIVVTSGGVEVLRLPGGSGALALTGTAGDDILAVDFSAGSPIPSGGLSFDGGAGNDGIRATGTAADVAHTFVDGSSGSIVVDGRTLTYTGLEPIWDLVAAATRTFTFTGANDTVTISDDGTAGDGVSQIDSPLSEIVYFAHPTGAVTVNTLGGADAVTVSGFDTASRPPSLGVNTGAGADAVTTVALAGIAVSVDGGAQGATLALGGTATAVSHTFATATSGSLDADGATIAYASVTSLTDGIAAATRTFSFTGAADVVTVQDDGAPANGVSRITSALSAPVAFAHPSVLLAVSTGAGSDDIAFGALDAASRPPNVTLDAGDDADLVTVTPQTGVAFAAIGGAPVAVIPGDVLALDYAGAGATLAKVGGDGTITFSTGEGTITFTSMETTPQPDLAIGLVAAPTPGYPASVHTVTVTLVNSGPIGTSGVSVAFAIPVGLEILSAVAPGVTSVMTTATTATWTVPSIGGGQTLTLPVLVRVLSDVPQAPITAEVTAQDAPDLDSTPGDGAGDDFASTTLVVAELAALPNNALALGVTFDAQGRAYVGTYGYGVFRSSGNGGWTAVNTGLTNAFVWDVQTHPSGTIVATTWGGGVFVSANQGTTWTHAATVQGAYIRGLALATDGALYATGDAVAPLATSETGTARVWKSTDGGLTWTALPWITRTAIEPWSIATDPSNPRILYMGSRKGAYKSIDGGTTWTPTGFFGKRADAYALQVTLAGTVLIGTRDGIVRSTDGGATFTPVQLSVPAGRSRNVYDIEYHPISGRIYIAHWGRPGVVVSTDDAMSFTDVPLSAAPPADVYVERVAVGPNGAVYMMLEGGGMIVDRSSVVTSVETLPTAAPDALALALGGSNPVRTSTALRVGLPTAASARLDVYDALGRTVATLLSGDQAAGWQTVPVDASALAPGVYVARLVSGSHAATTRFVVVR